MSRRQIEAVLKGGLINTVRLRERNA